MKSEVRQGVKKAAAANSRAMARQWQNDESFECGGYVSALERGGADSYVEVGRWVCVETGEAKIGLSLSRAVQKRGGDVKLRMCPLGIISEVELTHRYHVVLLSEEAADALGEFLRDASDMLIDADATGPSAGTAATSGAGDPGEGGVNEHG